MLQLLILAWLCWQASSSFEEILRRSAAGQSTGGFAQRLRSHGCSIHVAAGNAPEPSLPEGKTKNTNQKKPSMADKLADLCMPKIELDAYDAILHDNI